eukprot:CAMPEP_0185732706 /NCGR_PEP_ID=MMETSP1171-20130828/17282_1 /TAXON_ID=374046 /ORGANISM="Helicotheca tamensis, Strain CCMP826" /LENGTH=217 /DNA_ID=CAMNT_0028402273 /DNA_START=232 /DNA_END=882 /DNA_ORIENTATION=+
MNNRPIHDPATWTILREAYEKVVGKERSTIGDISHPETTAFRVPYSARQSAERGRGIFAEADIAKGEIVYDFSRSAQFRDGASFLEFLRIIPYDLACDVLMWTYIQDLSGEREDYNSEDEEEDYNSEDEEEDYYSEDEEDDYLMLITDLDAGSFCNNGRWHANIGWFSDDDYYHVISVDGDEKRNKYKRSYPHVALRDIKAGEELLCNYEQFNERNW